LSSFLHGVVPEAYFFRPRRVSSQMAPPSSRMSHHMKRSSRRASSVK